MFNEQASMKQCLNQNQNKCKQLQPVPINLSTPHIRFEIQL
jgi:hypothetical protein